MADADQVVSIRVPAGLPEKIRALTGQPFSKIVRFMLVAYYEAEKAKRLSEGTADPNKDLRQDMTALVTSSINQAPGEPA